MLLLPALGLLAAECSKSDIQGEKVAVSFAATGVEADVAPVRALTTAPLPANTQVRVSARLADGTVSSQAYVSDAAAKLNGDPLYLYPSVNEYTINAWAPSLALNSGNATVSVTQGSDFIAAADMTVKVPVQASLNVTLPVFSHKCARVQVDIVKEDGYTILKTLEIGSGGVVLADMPAGPGTYTLGGDIAPDNTPTGTMTFSPSDFTALSDGRTGFRAVGFSLPKGKKAIPVTFNLVLDGTANVFKGNVPEMLLTKGLGYKFIFTLHKTAAIFELSLTDWAGHDVEFEVGGNTSTSIVIGSWEIHDIDHDMGAPSSSSLVVWDWTPHDIDHEVGAAIRAAVSRHAGR